MVDRWLYPRTIAIKRQAAVNAVGAVATYGGARPSAETTLHADLPASIQFASTGGANQSDVPSAASRRGRYDIFIPVEGGGALSLQFERGDIVIDDRGFRYQVFAPYWDSLGWRLITEHVEV